MPDRAGWGSIVHVTAVSPQLVEVVALAVAGLLMVLAGSSKRRLAWKSARRRCPVCGRTGHHHCRR